MIQIKMKRLFPLLLWRQRDLVNEGDPTTGRSVIEFENEAQIPVQRTNKQKIKIPAIGARLPH